MTRIALLNGQNRNHDYDFSKLVEHNITAWVVQGLEVTTGQISLGYAFVQVTRASERTFYMIAELTENETIDTTGTKKVRLQIDQTKVDDWSSNALDWSWILTIETGASYPASSVPHVKLASITGGTITDERAMISLKLWVSKTGDETIDGVKTFSSSPIVPTATQPTQAVNKQLLDDTVGATDISTEQVVLWEDIDFTNDYQTALVKGMWEQTVNNTTWLIDNTDFAKDASNESVTFYAPWHQYHVLSSLTLQISKVWSPTWDVVVDFLNTDGDIVANSSVTIPNASIDWSSVNIALPSPMMIFDETKTPKIRISSTQANDASNFFRVSTKVLERSLIDDPRWLLQTSWNWNWSFSSTEYRAQRFVATSDIDKITFKADVNTPNHAVGMQIRVQIKVNWVLVWSQSTSYNLNSLQNISQSYDWWVAEWDTVDRVYRINQNISVTAHHIQFANGEVNEEYNLPWFESVRWLDPTRYYLSYNWYSLMNRVDVLAVAWWSEWDTINTKSFWDIATPQSYEPASFLSLKSGRGIIGYANPAFDEHIVWFMKTDSIMSLLLLEERRQQYTKNKLFFGGEVIVYDNYWTTIFATNLSTIPETVISQKAKRAWTFTFEATAYSNHWSQPSFAWIYKNGVQQVSAQANNTWTPWPMSVDISVEIWDIIEVKARWNWNSTWGAQWLRVKTKDIIWIFA